MASLLLNSSRSYRSLALGVTILTHVFFIILLWNSSSSHLVNDVSKPTQWISFYILPSTPKALAPVIAHTIDVKTFSSDTSRSGILARKTKNRQSATSVRSISVESPLQTKVATVTTSEILVDIAESTVNQGALSFDIATARASARVFARDHYAIPAESSIRQNKIHASNSERIQERFEKARRSDCFKAYSESMNLYLNIALLARDALKDIIDASGCKW